MVAICVIGKEKKEKRKENIKEKKREKRSKEKREEKRKEKTNEKREKRREKRRERREIIEEKRKGKRKPENMNGLPGAGAPAQGGRQTYDPNDPNIKRVSARESSRWCRERRERENKKQVTVN